MGFWIALFVQVVKCFERVHATLSSFAPDPPPPASALCISIVLSVRESKPCFLFLGPDLYHPPSVVISNSTHSIVFKQRDKSLLCMYITFSLSVHMSMDLIPCLRSQELRRLVRACELKAERTNLDLIARLIRTVPFFGKHTLRFPQNWLRGGSQCRSQNGLHIAQGTGHSPQSSHLNTEASSRPQLQPPLDKGVIPYMLSSFDPK